MHRGRGSNRHSDGSYPFCSQPPKSTNCMNVVPEEDSTVADLGGLELGINLGDFDIDIDLPRPRPTHDPYN